MRNVNAAIKEGNRLLEQGFVPFIPHLTHFWHAQHPQEYGVWLGIDLQWLGECDVMFVIDRSPGVDIEIEYASQRGIPVYHREQWDEILLWASGWRKSKNLVQKAVEAVQPKGDPRFHTILKELGSLHDKKQADYGSNEDPFANVRASEDWNIPAWVGAMIRAMDKVKRLKSYAQKGTLANEGVEDAFNDLAVYAVIARILWEEERVPDRR